MKINLHRSADRGLNASGWLVSRFSFSFSRYWNPDRLGFGRLLVLNDDLIAPSMGFDTHHHDDMEIVTIVTEGELAHQDNTGGQGLIRPGEVQIMSAGTGIEHSEHNPSSENYLKLFQLWILPEKGGLPPRYEQKAFDSADRHNKLQLIVSPDASNNSLKIFQQAWLSLCDLEANQEITYQLHNPASGLFIFVIEGDLQSADQKFSKGDSLELSEISEPVKLQAKQNSQLLFIEVPL